MLDKTLKNVLSQKDNKYACEYNFVKFDWRKKEN